MKFFKLIKKNCFFILILFIVCPKVLLAHLDLTTIGRFRPKVNITYWHGISPAELSHKNDSTNNANKGMLEKYPERVGNIRVDFDRQIDIAIVKDFVRFFEKFDSFKVVSIDRNGFLIRASYYINKKEMENILNQAKDLFYDEIKKAEQLEIEKRNRVIVRREQERKEIERKKEQERKEREYKEEIERRKRELEEAIQKEQREEELKKQAKERAEAERLVRAERERVAAIEREKQAKEATIKAEKERRLRIEQENLMLSQGVDKREYHYLMDRCNQIAAEFASIGGMRSSAYPYAFFSYLRNIGTITAFWVLKKQIEMGRVPADWLNDFDRF
ncbi:MAG: hypothetical protein ABIA74_04920 [bacterium]